MKFYNKITVNISLEQLIALFENPDNLKKWQPNIISFEHLSGEIGQVGAKSRIHYDLTIRKIMMVETIIKRNLPDEFVILYESDGVSNTVTNSFMELNEDQTQWTVHNEFQFSGVMKFAAGALKSVFKKQTELTQERFKDFAEKQTN